MNSTSKSRVFLAASAAVAVLSAHTVRATTPNLAVQVEEELASNSAYTDQNGNYNPGSDHSIGFAFTPTTSGTEITAVEADLQIGFYPNADNHNPNYPDGLPNLTNDNVRIYAMNSSNAQVTQLSSTTVTSTDPINPMTTGGGVPPGGASPSGGVISYNTHQLAKPLILYPVANLTYFVAYDLPAAYDLFNGTSSNPGDFTTDPTINFDGYVQTPGLGNDPTTFPFGLRLLWGENVNLQVQAVVITTPANLTYTNASGNRLWDTSSLNFSNGSGGTVAYSDTSNTLVGDGDNVKFDDTNGGAGNYNVSIPAVLNPSFTTVSNSAGNYFFNGSGGIAGPGGLTKSGTASLTLAVSNSYTGATNVSGGSLILAVGSALPSGTNLNIAAGASVVANNLGTAYALSVGSLAVGGRLDLNNNDLIAHNSSIGSVTAMVASGYNSGRWNGTNGIISTAAASNSSHLTTLGVIINDNGSGTPLYGTSGSLASSFGGSTPVDGDVLVKYTYYGDTNLDGKVDGTDYSRIDSAYTADLTAPGSVTGWYNGDFNYDGVINGSDYTLIDNAFNTQGGQISVQLASPLASSTAEIAGGLSPAGVPEPTTLGLLAMGSAALLGRRQPRR